ISLNSALSFLYPVVLTFERLLDITSTLNCCAFIPELAIQSALIIGLHPPVILLFILAFILSFTFISTCTYIILCIYIITCITLSFTFIMFFCIYIVFCIHISFNYTLFNLLLSCFYHLHYSSYLILPTSFTAFSKASSCACKTF